MESNAFHHETHHVLHSHCIVCRVNISQIINIPFWIDGYNRLLKYILPFLNPDIHETLRGILSCVPKGWRDIFQPQTIKNKFLRLHGTGIHLWHQLHSLSSDSICYPTRVKLQSLFLLCPKTHVTFECRPTLQSAKSIRGILSNQQLLYPKPSMEQ